MDQWEALKSIYDSTNGEHWSRQDFWNFSTYQEKPYCFWYGINCNKEYGITDIVLMDNNLNGSLPRTLWKLRYLENLTLNSNKNLGGKLEDFIYGNMSKLKKIDLSFCGFEGAIPEEITLLTNLEELRLCSQRGAKKLNGSIPEGIANLNKLRFLGLGENNLTAPSPRFIGALTNLEVLDLEDVKIRSTFDVFCSLTGLKSLNLSKTELFGELPPNIGILFPKMEELLLPGNNLNGSIPYSIGRMKSLSRLSLANNKLSGPIPGNITLGSRLSFLDLSVNNLSSIDNESSHLLSHDLEILLLSDNPNLNVSFAKFLNNHVISDAGPAKLNVLIIENCSFQGEIPKSIWSFMNLIYVNVGNNKLSGRLPEVLAPMYTLLHFDVSRNQLEGTIPSTLTRIESLHYLDIRGNPGMIACKEFDEYHPYSHSCNETIEQHGLEITFNYMTKYMKGNFSCPRALLKVTKGPVFLDAMYYGYAFCKCDRGYYGEGRRCKKCMDGGKCVDKSPNMTIRKGYWPEPGPGNVTHLTSCNDEADFFTAGGRRLTTCNPSGNCKCHLSRTSTITTCNNTCLCREGSFRRLCSRCKKRWYKSGSICRKCPSHHHATYIFIGVLVLTLLIFVAALLYLRNRPRLSLLVIYGQIIILFVLRVFNVIPGWVFEINVIILLFYLAGMGSSMKGLLKIAVFYFQILDAMLSTYKLWPKAILQGQHYISSLINFNFPGLMCDFQDLYTPAGQFRLLILLPVVCILITWLFYCLVWIAHRIRAHRWNVLSIKYHCLQISVTCLNLTYFPIGLRSIAVLASCRGHSSHMHIAPWIPCNSQSSNSLESLAWLSIAIYVIGVPLFVFLPLLLCYVRADKRSELKEHEKEALDKWLGSIYLPYKEKCRSFCEVYALLRKLLLAFLIGYIPEMSSLQTFFVSLVLAVALIFHLVWQPYQSSLGWIPVENILETIVLVVLQQSFILLRFATVEKPSDERVDLLWIIVAVNCIVVFFLMVIISVLLAKHAAKSLKNRSKNESSRVYKNDFLSYFKSKNSLFKPLLLQKDKDTTDDE